MTKLIYLVGLPASGKSTYAEKIKNESENTIILSSDELRKSLLNDINNQKENGYIFDEMQKRTIKYLKEGFNVVYDATNVNSKKRIAFLNSLKDINCEKICVIVATPFDECIKRNNKRERKVPEDVIMRMYKQWQTPYFFEGWDDIKIQKDDEVYNNTAKLFYDIVNKMDGFNQDNPHHKYDLYEHSKRSRKYIENIFLDSNYELKMAAAYHDIGKLKVKEFKNTHGETTKEAHYYNHDNVGAYDSLFLFYGFGNYFALDVSVLINYHMHPFWWNEEKARLKFGDDLVNQLLLVHAADLASS